MKKYILLCAVLVGLMTGIPSRSDEVPSQIPPAPGSERARAQEVMTLVAQDLLALKGDKFPELAELKIELPVKWPSIVYEYKTVYVPLPPGNQPHRPSYTRVEAGGCKLRVQCFSAGEAGWAGFGPVGPTTSWGSWRFRRGGQVMFDVDTPNPALREAVMAILAKRFAADRQPEPGERQP